MLRYWYFHGMSQFLLIWQFCKFVSNAISMETTLPQFYVTIFVICHEFSQSIICHSHYSLHMLRSTLCTYCRTHPLQQHNLILTWILYSQHVASFTGLINSCRNLFPILFSHKYITNNHFSVRNQTKWISTLPFLILKLACSLLIPIGENTKKIPPAVFIVSSPPHPNFKFYNKITFQSI